ncbi:phage tail protein [Bacterioplanoides sp.]|uniref:phage tail protein n=1 Tax=Bacterioplanoides sp. TaxID=2066072 RepID=UPI003B58D28C
MSYKLQQVTDFLVGLNFVPEENIDNWVDLCSVIPESRNMGKYLEICRLHHQCTLLIERYTGDSRLITAWVSAWLHDHDPDRDSYQLPDPDIDIEALDASGTQWDIDISIEFVEPVMVVMDDTGNIPWQGQRWSLIDDPLVDVAESVEEVEPEDRHKGVSDDS